MRTPARRTGWSLTVRLAVGVAIIGVICIVAGLLIAYLIADHSSADSSPSSLTAIGLGCLGFLLILLSAVLFIGHGRGPLWRWLRKPPREAPGGK